MKRTETLELLIEIQEAIEHFEKRINELEWSNACIVRLNERFTKQLNTLK